MGAWQETRPGARILRDDSRAGPARRASDRNDQRSLQDRSAIPVRYCPSHGLPKCRCSVQGKQRVSYHPYASDQKTHPLGNRIAQLDISRQHFSDRHRTASGNGTGNDDTSTITTSRDGDACIPRQREPSHRTINVLLGIVRQDSEVVTAAVRHALGQRNVEMLLHMLTSVGGQTTRCGDGGLLDVVSEGRGAHTCDRHVQLCAINC